MNRIDYTAVVIGAGPAGSAAARVLARAGLNVLLAGAQSSGASQVGESLAPASRIILEDLGILDTLFAYGHLPCYGNSSAWGSTELVDSDFIRSPYGHGWHLDRPRFDGRLRRMAQEAGATVWSRARLIHFERKRATWLVTLGLGDSLKRVSCEWLLDCTGRSRSVVKGLGIARHYEDRLLAFYSSFRPGERAEEDEDTRTLVESVPEGWFHTALLPSGERIVTFFTDAGTSWVRHASSRNGFLDLIKQTVHVSRKIEEHGYTASQEPHATDARSSRLERFHGEGWLAVGDAATCFDPLSSQGILSALYSGLKAGNAVAGHLSRDNEALLRYESDISNVYDAFLGDRLRYYGFERRWPESPFWKGRLIQTLSRS